MQIKDIIGFRDDLFFEGAVQIDWFYNPSKADKVASSFVFHGKEYFGVSDEENNRRLTDTVSFLKSITEKIEDNQQVNPLTLVIAEYGTGKSHLAVTLAQILSGKNYMPDTYQKIIDNISRIDEEAANTIKEVTDKPNLVLAINGMRDFNLNYEILKAAIRSLKLYGYSEENLRKVNRAYDTASRFLERNIDTNISLFEKKAETFNWIERGNALRTKLLENLFEDRTAFDIVNSVYEEINGHEIRWDEGVYAGSVLETLYEEYCGKTGEFDKIIIIFDEFGRYLEYASSATSAQSGDSALQQMFEAAQNAEGNIHIINFIQSDIKAYLQRVDKTSNISRYIGRYDVSEKFYLSSNLETVFANLIGRKDKSAFDTYIKSWISRKKGYWNNLYKLMDRWLPLRGIWKDETTFHTTIVEGIYPLHPIATYMLTGLSGYLQNRSSLTLVNKNISALSDHVITEGRNCPLILPEQLLDGDLYSEMLAAEQEGRQLSRHCIKFDNILRKIGDKLSENMIKVLRANLVLKLLRFRTESYEDAKFALCVCSGLTVKSVDEALEWLENEYAVLGYDEVTNSFDFLEDSSGAHDFRTFYRRIKAGQTVSMPTILHQSDVRELAGILSPIATNFNAKVKITSSEWCFEQEMFHVSEITEKHIETFIKRFEKATDPETSKGQLIWLYINKDTDDSELEKVIKLTEKLIGKPIVMFLLNDKDNKLYSALLDYEILAHGVPDQEKEKYGRFYTEALSQAENVLKGSFAGLKGERLMIQPSEIRRVDKRLSVALTDVFSSVYPKIIPFNFDGFDVKRIWRARNSLCSIVRLLLSDSINANTVQSLPVDIRNRFEATLFEGNIHSWRCVNLGYQIVPPKEQRTFEIYTMLEKRLLDNEEIKFSDIFKELTMPPYGLNEYVIVYLISVLCANLRHNLKLTYKDTSYSVSKWKDIAVSDKAIHFEVFTGTSAVFHDVKTVHEKYKNLFRSIQGNNDIYRVNHYYNLLDDLQKTDELPTELEAECKLNLYKLEQGKQILDKWTQRLNSIKLIGQEAIDGMNINKALNALENIESRKIFDLFTQDYPIPKKEEGEIARLAKELRAFVEQASWLKHQKCHSMQDITRFQKVINNIYSRLNKLGFFRTAEQLKIHAENELISVKLLEEKEEVRKRCELFLEDYQVGEFVSYVNLLEWEKYGYTLITYIEKHKKALGSDYIYYYNKVAERLSEITKSHEQIKSEMDEIWNDIYDLSDFNAVISIINRIDAVCKKGISESDINDFLELKAVLEGFIADIKALKELNNDLHAFLAKYRSLTDKYSRNGIEIDVLHILHSIAEEELKVMKNKEKIWIEYYILRVSKDMSRTEALKWIEATRLLPKYLSEETIEQYEKTKKVVERLLSDANIEDVVFHFRKLNVEERKKCINILFKYIN